VHVCMSLYALIYIYVRTCMCVYIRQVSRNTCAKSNNDICISTHIYIIIHMFIHADLFMCTCMRSVQIQMLTLVRFEFAPRNLTFPFWRNSCEEYF